MLKYQSSVTTQTLREGIRELRDFEGVVGDVSLGADDEMAETLRAHDAVHVVFGCDTTVHDEALAHFVMIFGTTVTLADVRKTARSSDHRRIVSRHGTRQIISVVLGAGSDLIQLFRLKRKMKKRWPWFGYKQHLDRPIPEIRKEFGIAPISRSLVEG